jgi:hypothetical protein
MKIPLHFLPRFQGLRRKNNKWPKEFRVGRKRAPGPGFVRSADIFMPPEA